MNVFELLDDLYNFAASSHRDAVPDFRSGNLRAIREYLNREEYSIENEEKIMVLPMDVQILLITKEAIRILETHGNFAAFARGVGRDRACYGPN